MLRLPALSVNLLSLLCFDGPAKKIIYLEAVKNKKPFESNSLL